MTTAHLTRHQARKPAQRGIVGFLLLHRIDWTDANPWFGFVGALVAGMIFAVIKAVLL